MGSLMPRFMLNRYLHVHTIFCMVARLIWVNKSYYHGLFHICVAKLVLRSVMVGNVRHIIVTRV